MPLDLGLATLGAGGMGLAGSLFGMKSSAKAASDQEDFQRYMSNTAYRRAVKDMRKAGINPVLAAGNPASTPQGALAQVPNFGDAISKGASSGIALVQAKNQIEQVRAQTEEIANQARSSGVEAQFNEDMIKLLDNDPEVRGWSENKRAVLSAMVAKKGGLRPEAGVVKDLIDQEMDATWSAHAKAKNARVIKQLRESAERRRQEFKKDPRYFDRMGNYKPGSLFDIDNMWPSPEPKRR